MRHPGHLQATLLNGEDRRRSPVRKRNPERVPTDDTPSCRGSLGRWQQHQIFLCPGQDDRPSAIPHSAASFSASAAAFSSLTAKTSTLPKTYTAGSTGSDMIAQVAYKRTSIISWASKYLGASDLLISTIAFQNEPY